MDINRNNKNGKARLDSILFTKYLKLYLERYLFNIFTDTSVYKSLFELQGNFYHYYGQPMN